MKANELKVTDLMVGDWVSVISAKPNTYRQSFYQIITVEKMMMIRNGRMVVEPIPLTPEILEKNGFTLENKVKHPARYIYNASYSNSVIVDFDCYNNGRGAMKCILAGVGLVSNSFIRIYGKDIYVHQLQHALKACEISKEIVV